MQRFGVINQLPPLLQISISRVMYDRERRAGYKIEHHLKFDDVVYLDRYVDDADASLMQRRRQSWSLKRQLRKLRARQQYLDSTSVGLDLPSAVDATAELVGRLHAHESRQKLLRHGPETSSDDEATPSAEDRRPDEPEGSDDQDMPPAPENETESDAKQSESNEPVTLETKLDPNLMTRLKAAAEELRSEKLALDAEISQLELQIQELFTPFRRLPYRLHAVFIHRGTAAGGHYWVYIQDFAAKPSVTSVPTPEPSNTASEPPPSTPTAQPESGQATSDEAGETTGVWRCYNDSAVSVVADPERTIFAEDATPLAGLRRATPNLLVYVREDVKEQMVQAVCRHVEQQLSLDAVDSVDSVVEVDKPVGAPRLELSFDEQRSQAMPDTFSPFAQSWRTDTDADSITANGGGSNSSGRMDLLGDDDEGVELSEIQSSR